MEVHHITHTKVGWELAEGRLYLVPTAATNSNQCIGIYRGYRVYQGVYKGYVGVYRGYIKLIKPAGKLEVDICLRTCPCVLASPPRA